MDANAFIIITGASGFIGQHLVRALYPTHGRKMIVVDDFHNENKVTRLKPYSDLIFIDRKDLFLWLDTQNVTIEMVFHLGARTDTLEQNEDLLFELNTAYSRELWKRCVRFQIPLIFASSAATYGAEESNFSDSHDNLSVLKPLNAYARSKHIFDTWVLHQKEQPPFWYGLKFFNVYGPGEKHKGKMSSMVYHAYHQINRYGRLKLFKSYRDEIADGCQKRDFIYVDDVINIMCWLAKNHPESGIFNIGTGQSRSFYDLAQAVFKSLDEPLRVMYIDMPENMQNKYQYFTQAHMHKLLEAGYPEPFTSLEAGVADYIQKLRQST